MSGPNRADDFFSPGEPGSCLLQRNFLKDSGIDAGSNQQELFLYSSITNMIDNPSA